MALTVTGDQRDALRDQILDRLSGIGDIELAVKRKDFNTAERLGREYCDDLRLLLEDLGFGKGDGKPIELTTPPDVLHRLLPRLRDRAIGHTASQERQRVENEALERRNCLVVGACQSLLTGLDERSGTKVRNA